MISKLVAAFAAVFLFLVVGAFSVPLLIGVPAPITSSDDRARPIATLEQSTSNGLLKAELFLLPDLGYRLDLLLSRDPAAPPPRIQRPTVILEMEGMAMGRTELPLLLVAMGEFSASGLFPMPGQWRFRIGFEDELFDLPVRVPEAALQIPLSSPDSLGRFVNRPEGAWL